MERLRVELGTRSYDILIGERLLARAGALLAAQLAGRRAIIVSDETVARLYLHRLCNALDDANIRYTPIILPPGEQSKSFATLEHLVESVLALAPDRNSVLVALGGGVMGDLTGFAASILLRGLEFIQIPTTLLSQVDSSVGGKTGINTRHGKNLAGSFHQPRAVLIDVSALQSLPPRELRAGYAEVVKYGLINDAAFFSWLEANGADALAGDMPKLIHIIRTSCAAKAAIVAADERERDARALLNLGHTFGHALEAETGFGPELLHGEAVAIGMHLAFRLSVQLGLCPEADADAVEQHLRTHHLPASPRDIRPHWSVDALLGHMAHDKKAKDGKLTFILARGIGQSFVQHGVDEREVRKLLNAYNSL